MSDPLADPLAAEVLAELRRRRQTLATAESLTGGLIGARVTAVPGASDCYRGGLITYATALKAALAGVDEATLAEVGPVAAQTAAEMAVGAANRCGADWGLSVTGVAGPTPQDGHPVGQVFVGLAGPGGHVRTVELGLTGGRAAIRDQSAEGALRLLLEDLDEAGNDSIHRVVDPKTGP